MNIDVLAFTGHKGLMGSTGIGGLCVRKHVDIRQTRAGGTGVRSAYPTTSTSTPGAWNSVRPTWSASPLSGPDRTGSTDGVEKTHAREMQLAQKFIDGLRTIEGVKLYCCDSLKNHLSTVSMNVESLEAGDVGTMLDVDHNVATRTGLHCAPLVHEQLGLVPIHGAVRFSVGAFNTEDHIDTAIEGVRQIARWSKERQGKRAAAAAPVHA